MSCCLYQSESGNQAPYVSSRGVPSPPGRTANPPGPPDLNFVSTLWFPLQLHVACALLLSLLPVYRLQLVFISFPSSFLSSPHVAHNPCPWFLYTQAELPSPSSPISSPRGTRNPDLSWVPTTQLSSAERRCAPPELPIWLNQVSFSYFPYDPMVSAGGGKGTVVLGASGDRTGTDGS